MNDLGAGISDLGSGEMAETPASHSLEQCVPLASLGVPGEGEQMENPEVGDQVNFEVAGKVTRIEGDKAYVMPESFNGQPVEETPEPADDLAGLESMANQTGYLGALLIAFMLLLANICSADRIGSGPIAIERADGSVTGGHDSITNALRVANPGDTVHVGPGTYHENNLWKPGVNITADPGANLVYVQESVTDPGWGIFDDRLNGPGTNWIRWPGKITMITFTNMAKSPVDGTFAFIENIGGAVCFTNPASEFHIEIGHLEYGQISQSQGANFGGAVALIRNQPASTLNINRLTDVFVDETFSDGEHSFNSIASGIVWDATTVHVNIRWMERFRQYGAWGIEQFPGSATNDFYYTGDLIESKVYSDGHSVNNRTWWNVLEMRGKGPSNTGGVLAFYGAGKHYVTTMKVDASGFGSGEGSTIGFDLGPGGSGTNNLQVWANVQKITAYSDYVNITTNRLFLTCMQWEDVGPADSDKLTVNPSPGGAFFPTFAVSGKTNISASGSSLVVNLLNPMPDTNYVVTLSHAFNPVAIPSITAHTRSNFTISYSTGVTTGGDIFWTAALRAQ